MSPQASLELVAWVRLLRGHAALTRKLNAQLTDAHGLTINDYEALLLLSHSDDRRMRRVDLAEEVQLTASGITRLLDGLQDAGLVERVTCDSDARVAYARLTDDGLGKLRAASGGHIAAIHELFTGLYSDSELATLAELLARLPGAGNADPEACSAGDE